MEYTGAEFFNDAAVLDTYMQHRYRKDSPNNSMEGPVIRELVGDVIGQRVLDLGCGDGRFGLELLDLGAVLYLGLEGAGRMVALADKHLEGRPGRVLLQQVEDWDYPPEAFDLVVSRLALHYVADLSALCKQIYRTLKPGGRLVFSVEHPVITSCDRSWPADTPRQEWTVDDYFITGERVTRWLGSTVRKYHRTVEDHFAALQSAGLAVVALREGAPHPEHFHDQQTFERRRRIPLFLFLVGRKRA
ncbi:MAG TPA: methyltransferase domain-containing protein [Roseiflexaceae bacterium]|nr:methyltransferase domain-containing protein [Roseiflexaceae bacterium]